MKKQKSSLNFFKKFYYSLFKMDKYGELSSEGVKKSIKYIIDILIALSIIYAAIIVTQTQKSLNKLRSYISDNLPSDLVVKDNSLLTEHEERVVLDNELVLINFGGQIVLDVKTEYEDMLNEYKQTEIPTILLTTNYYTTIDEKGNVTKMEYNDIIKKFLGENVKKIDKEELLYLFDNYSSGYYFTAYMISYAIANSILIFVYTLILSIGIFIFCKIKKVKIKFLEIYSMGLYSLTVTTMGFFVTNFLAHPLANIVQGALLIVSFVILVRAIYINKWITPQESK